MSSKKKFGLLLAPGAGADSTAPGLLAVEQAMPEDFPIRRIDFPYRLAGRKSPDPQAVLLKTVQSEHLAFCNETALAPDQVFVGGRSMGGRMCSIAVAEGMETAGCVLISYPLHPPGRPDKLRTDHFPAISVPCLFVSGTRDTFGTPEEFLAHTHKITADVEHQWLDGADHGLRRHNDQAAALVVDWLGRQTTELRS